MLRINEVFESIDGEINPFHQGHFTTFIRVANCNLRCSYCDSTTAQKIASTDRILHTSVLIKQFYKAHIKPFTSGKVTITGGEPLLQEEGVNCLIDLLISDNIYVTVETNGSIQPARYYSNPCVGYVVDYKLPSSGMEYKMNLQFMKDLSPQDVLKFVIGDYFDYKRARQLIKEQFNNSRATLAMQPVYDKLDPKLLYEWVKRDKLRNIILSVQIHKLLKMK